MNNDTQIIRTHTYWMTTKEYKKWSKNRPDNIQVDVKSKSKSNNNNVVTRTHIHFV